MSRIDTYIAAALERLAATEATAAAHARTRGDRREAAYFQRAANAYARALGYHLDGVRPQQTPGGWLLPSQRPGEAPHLLRLDGSWTCSCKSGQHIHWASALIIGIEVAHDDMGRLDGGDEDLEIEQETPPPPPPALPGIVVSQTDSGALTFSRDNVTAFVTTPEDVAGAIARLAGPVDGRALGQRLAAARARLAA
jgi:hypothetical protein